MKRWLLLLLYLFSAYFCVSSAQTMGKIDRLSLYEKDLLILGEGRRGPYLLPDSLIIENSEQVYINNQLLSKSAYELNYISGELRFINSVTENVPIRILYKKSPVALLKTYTHRPLLQRVFGAPTETATMPVGKSKTVEEDYAGQLTKSGSITRGVTVGNNRGLKVNSSLNLNVSGKVADNVEVVAALTDQSTPIQPEGTTQNLQEIDKVFVQVKSPHLSATMGDYYLELPESQFARYNRKLQGAMAKADYTNLKVTVSGAVSRGKYYSLTLAGQEGNQGPYQLKGDRGQIDIIVLAGTERVFIDGEAMVRGETNDYIIDYSTAQITFSRRRLITADSRLVVDFQYSDEKFRRNLYAARAETQAWQGRFKFSGTLLSESDDKNNPLDFTLSADKLSVLRQAGDDRLRSVVDGAVYVGPGQGRYVREATGHYRYTSADSGDYRVSFSDMGENLGAYRNSGLGVYEFVGQGQGRYEPVILLTPATQHTLAGFSFELSPLTTLVLNSELALSALDLNTYSSLNDQDNQGTAQNWQLRFNPDSLRLFGKRFGKLQVVGKYRLVQDRFRDIDRTTEVEYNRRWDLPSTAARGEEVREVQSRYEPWQGYSWTGEYGSIRKGDSFSSKRWQFENRLTRVKWPDYHYRLERINREESGQNRSADWIRQRGGLNYRLGRFIPSFDYEAELKKENWSDSLYTGFHFSSYTGGLEFRPGARFTTAAKMALREDQDYIGADRFVDKSTAATQNLSLRLQQWGAFSGNLDFTHRERTFNDPKEENKNTDLAELRVAFAPWRSALNSEFNYQISNTATAKKERIYIRVNQGDGNYRFDEQLNEYVNDPLGDYVMRVLTTDELMPVVELKASSRIQLSAGRFFTGRNNQSKKPHKKWQKILSAFSSETFANIEERTQEKEVWQIYLMNLSKFRRPATTIYGNLQLRQDLFLFEHSRDFSLRLRYQSRDEKNNQYIEGGQDRLEREYNARMTNRFSERLSSQSELTRKRTARIFGFIGRQNRDVYADQLRLDISFRPRQVLELAVENRYSREEDRVYAEPTRVTALAITPRVNYAVKSKGRLRGEIEYSQVTSQPKGRVIPYEMANGRSLGRSINWDVRFDYRVSLTIQASLSYSGRNEPLRRGTIHTGRAQVTAAFR
jgi:hypothetical protein